MLTDWKTLVTSESSSTCDEMIENSACVQSNNKGCLASTGRLSFGVRSQVGLAGVCQDGRR